MKIKILTGLYVFFLAVIIFIADLHGTRYLLDFVGDVRYADKIGHFILMGTFSLLANLSLRAKTFCPGNTRFRIGDLSVAAIVTLEEFSQLFISGRSFDWADLAADYAGIFLFGWLAEFVCNKNKK